MKNYKITKYIVLVVLAFSLFFVFRNEEPKTTDLEQDNGFNFVVESSPVTKDETEIVKTGIVNSKVPFIPQAPLSNWSDPRQQDSCEEASALMAMYWVRNQETPSLAKAESELIAISDWELENYGTYTDTSVADTAERIFKGYFKYENVEVINSISIDNIIEQLENDNLVIVMANGRALDNPNFRQPGPERHALLITGYDYDKKEFITNDPGTRKGSGYRYSEDVLFLAIRDYPTGNHEPIISEDKNMIVVKRNI